MVALHSPQTLLRVGVFPYFIPICNTKLHTFLFSPKLCIKLAIHLIPVFDFAAGIWRNLWYNTQPFPGIELRGDGGTNGNPESRWI